MVYNDINVTNIYKCLSFRIINSKANYTLLHITKAYVYILYVFTYNLLHLLKIDAKAYNYTLLKISI